MTKQEFLTALKEKLNSVSEDKKKEYLDYYEELLNDKIEDGMTEEEAVGQIDINRLPRKLKFLIKIDDGTNEI